MNNNDIKEKTKKNEVSLKKGLRVSATNRRTPLTGGAEMHQRGARRTGHTGNGTDRDETLEEKSEVNEAGRAKKLGRITVDFVSTLFEIIEYLKRYVGGLVHSMDQPLHIALVGNVLRNVTDYLVSASLFERFPVNFVNLKHNKQMTIGYVLPRPGRFKHIQ